MPIGCNLKMRFLALLYIPICLTLGSVGHTESMPQGDQLEVGVTTSPHTLVAELSDQQVRQMLLRELQKSAAEQAPNFSFNPEEQGPAAPFAKLLNTFNNNTTNSEARIRTLWQGVPHLFPDLKKTFVNL